MKLNHFTQMLFLLIVLNKKVKNNPDMKKEPSFRTLRGVWACLLMLSLQTTRFGSFPDLIHFSQFLATKPPSTNAFLASSFESESQK